MPRKRLFKAPLHFRRLELKYLIPDRYIPALIERIAPYTQPDPFLVAEGKGRHSYPVTSIYFDSIDLRSLHEKDAGLLSRRKVRLRTYEDEFLAKSPTFLEIKRRHDFVVSKDRISISPGTLHETLPLSRLLDVLIEGTEDGGVLSEIQVMQGWYNLYPTALVRYRRTPFIGMQDRRFRITIDSALSGVWRPQNLLGPQPYRSCTKGHSVVEVKCHHAVPDWWHDVIMEWNFGRMSISKYAVTVRTLRSHFASAII